MSKILQSGPYVHTIRVIFFKSAVKYWWYSIRLRVCSVVYRIATATVRFTSTRRKETAFR